MWKIPNEESLIEKFGKYAKIAGGIFVVLGIIGILYPVFMTIATVSFVSWLMLFAGVSVGYFTYKSNKRDAIGWLKSCTLVIVALYILYNPLTGAGTISLLFCIYFFMDAISSFSIGFSNKVHKSSWLWFINGIFSVVLGILFIINWPVSSMFLIGLFIGFSLFFDGIALLIGGSLFSKMLK